MYIDEIVEIPLYNSILLQVMISDEVKTLNKKLRTKQKSYYAEAWRSNTLNKNRKTIAVVFNPASGKNKITAGIIAHEAVHVKNMIFEVIGHTGSLTEDEPEAYLVEWIVEKIMEVFKRVDRKKYKNVQLWL